MERVEKLKRNIAAPALIVASMLGLISCGIRQERSAEPVKTERVLGQDLVTWSDGTQTYEGYNYNDGRAVESRLYSGEEKGKKWIISSSNTISCSGINGREVRTYTVTTLHERAINEVESETHSYRDFEGLCDDGVITAPEGSGAATVQYFEKVSKELSDN